MSNYTPVTHAYDKGCLRDCQTSAVKSDRWLASCSGWLGSRCRGLPGEGGRRPHTQAGKGMDVLGALYTDWRGSVFGGAQRPHHFPDDSDRPSRIQGPEKVRKIKCWEPEATRWAHFGGVCQGAKGSGVSDHSRSPTPCLSLAISC